MNLSKLSLAAILTTSAAYAISIEQFKAKKSIRYNGHDVTMKAKIVDINCDYTIGYGKSAHQLCKATAKHKMRNHEDQNINLLYEKFYKKKLAYYAKKGDYHFVSCTYAHKRHMMMNCSIH